MENIITPLIVGLIIIISYVVADKYGAKRKAGFWPTFVISIAFSPIVGWIFAWAKGVKSENITVKGNSKFNKPIINTAITLFIFIIFTSLIYVYNPINILANIGLRPNPKILNSQVIITENSEIKRQYDLKYANDDFFAPQYSKIIDGWDCEIKVDVKNEGKSGMILVSAQYYHETKEETLILGRNQYQTIHFRFIKTIKNGAHIIEIKSLE